MYIFSISLSMFKINFVYKTFLPTLLGPQNDTANWMSWVKKLLHQLLLNKGLNNVYTIKLIKHKIDKLHGMVSNNVGIIISILFHCLYNYL